MIVELWDAFLTFLWSWHCHTSVMIWGRDWSFLTSVRIFPIILLTRIYCIGTWVWILKVYGLDAKQTDSAVTLALFSQSITTFWIQFPIAWFVVITRFPIYRSIHSTWQILCCYYYLLGEQIVRYFFATCNNSRLQFTPHPNFYQFSKGCCIIYLQVDYFDWLFLGKYLYCKFLCNEYQHIIHFPFSW